MYDRQTRCHALQTVRHKLWVSQPKPPDSSSTPRDSHLATRTQDTTQQRRGDQAAYRDPSATISERPPGSSRHFAGVVTSWAPSGSQAGKVHAHTHTGAPLFRLAAIVSPPICSLNEERLSVNLFLLVFPCSLSFSVCCDNNLLCCPTVTEVTLF